MPTPLIGWLGFLMCLPALAILIALNEKTGASGFFTATVPALALLAMFAFGKWMNRGEFARDAVGSPEHPFDSRIHEGFVLVQPTATSSTITISPLTMTSSSSTTWTSYE